MHALVRILAMIFLVVVILCIWKTAEYFNTLPESNNWRGVLAWDMLVLFILAVALILVIALS